MTRLLSRLSIAAAATALCAAALAQASPPPRALTSEELAQERQNLEQWKAKRLASLTSENGWLTLSGLFWLKPGENTFGRAKSNTLILDNASLAERAGSFVVTGHKVRFVARPGAGVTHDGMPVSEIELAADTTDHPTMLKSGSLTFFLIERVGKLGVRVRDSENPHRKSFAGLEYFPVDDSWVVDARFEPTPGKKIPIMDIVGLQEDADAPGALVFTHGGKEYRLDAVLEEPGDTELFILFADGTSGKETYGAGRFMYVPLPSKDGLVRLNFNKAYNPPCAFSNFATCPLPPSQNRLTSVRVEAGEKTYSGSGE